jgi:NAD(P)-dependent dehydrogenase (short-subunit alcohol dehydrogenase family)
MKRLAGRAAIITGTASGIGRATATRFAEEGADVYLLDVVEEGLVETANLCSSSGGAVHHRLVDVRDEGAVDEAVADAAATLGKLDIVANIAGVQRWANSHEHSTDDYRLMMDVNVGGTFFMCRAALPHLIDSKGVILNTASTTSFAGLPYSAIYAASKGAVLQLTKSLALEYAKRGVRVNCVAPGQILTGMSSNIDFPKDTDFDLVMRQSSIDGTFAGPEVIANMFIMIASDEGSHMNGSCVVIDGGAIA